MRKSLGKFVLAAGIALATVTSLANAQSSNFDSRRFWDQLQKTGASMPAAFDGQKFFDELQKTGASATFSPRQFFDELQKTGAKLPATFDPQKFFEDLEKENAAQVPPMVKVK
jgi:hypothetical protein